MSRGPTTSLNMVPSRKATLGVIRVSKSTLGVTPSRRASLVMSREGKEISLEIVASVGAKFSTLSSKNSLVMTPSVTAFLITKYPGGSGSSSSGAFSVVATPPSNPDGEDGDCRLAISTRGFYYKFGGVWSLVGNLATVSNSEASFVTPSAGEGIAQLSTL